MTISAEQKNERPLRIGAVSYLNSKPLIYGLGQRIREAELVLDVPSRLADSLAAGRLDVALVPSIEFFRSPDYTIVSDACIACQGPVLSVKLFSRTPMAEIRTLALDEGSRTSVALVQILLQEKYGVAPLLQPLAIGASFTDCDTDAVLLIGDRAVYSPPGEFCEIWDLGDQWCRWTDLPFVFAMWVARQGVEQERVAALLNTARDDGLAHLDEIVAAESASLGLTRPQCMSYLRDNLHFRLGDRERQGLELFQRYVFQLGLLSDEKRGASESRESARIG